MANAEDEVLVVVSRIKNYVRATAGLNTSEDVMAKLSDAVRKVVQQGIERAKADGRKTLMERDIQG